MLTQKHLTYLASMIKLETKNFADIAEQYTIILDYLNNLSTIDTTDIEPLFTPLEKTTPLRADTPIPYKNPKELLRNAPETNQDFFVVPCIL